MASVEIYDQIKSAFQDIIAPELHALRGDMRILDQKIVGLDQKVDGVDARLTVKIDAFRTEMGSLRSEMGSLRGETGSLRSEMGSLRAELVAEIRRVDSRIDGFDRELKTAIDIRERLAALEARRPA
jgi:chromosome segregation ATPase